MIKRTLVVSGNQSFLGEETIVLIPLVIRSLESIHRKEKKKAIIEVFKK